MLSALSSIFAPVVSRFNSNPGVFALGAVISVGLGSIIVNAADNPMMQQAIMEFNRPIRRAVEPYIPRTQIELPRIFQSRERAARSMPSQTQALQQQAPRYLPGSRAPIEIAPPFALLSQPVAEPASRIDNKRPVKLTKFSNAATAGLSSGTNYCVRLCDGFAFPVGHADNASSAAQEAACQIACPGAETALYSAPQGAKDLDAAVRAGRPYTALPNASRYRQVLDKTCACRAVGETQSAAALLTDFTLRKGDIAMTRIGMRHFDGSKNFPHRASAFSDALLNVRDKREVAVLRGMEAASLRGVLPATASASIRARVISEIQQSERAAKVQTATSMRSPAGFQVMAPRPAAVRTGEVRVIERRIGLVAMN